MAITEVRAKAIHQFAVEYGVAKACEDFNLTRETLQRYIRMATRTIKPTKRILIFDIETAPMEVYCWGMWKQNINSEAIKEDWSMLCWCAKWLDSPDIIESASWRDGNNVRDDKACALALHALLDEADIVVAHNGKKFDVKRVNTRLLLHGIKPPKPYKVVDTLNIAKQKFAITSNRLDYIGEFLGIGRKVKHEGFSMWRKVLDGDKEAQERMLRYNVGDIVLLEQVYLALRGWDDKHPQVNCDYEVKRCNVCGCAELARDGVVCTGVSEFAAYQCCGCGHWVRGGSNMKDKDAMARTTRNAL